MQEIIKKKLFNGKGEYRFLSSIFSDEIYVCLINDEYVAISGFCPHYGGPLKLNSNNEFHCFWHDWKFDVNSLKCKNFSFKNKIKKYNVINNTDHLIISYDN